MTLPPLAHQFEASIQRLRDAAVHSYSLLLQSLERGIVVDPAMAAELIGLLGKTPDEVELDVARCLTGRRLQELVDRSDNQQANAESRRLIEQMSAEIYGDRIHETVFNGGNDQ